MGAVRFSHLIYFLGTGLEGLPTPAFQSAGKEGGCMEGQPRFLVKVHSRTFPAFVSPQIFFIALLYHLTEPVCSFIL